MANLEVTVTVKRGDQAHTYALTPAGESRKGNFALFQPAAENPDIPKFAKLYLSLPKTAREHKPTRKSERAAAKKHAGKPAPATGTPQTANVSLADIQKLIAKGVAEALKAAK